MHDFHTGTVAIRFARPDIATLYCQKMHELAICYQNFEQPDTNVAPVPSEYNAATVWYQVILDVAPANSEMPIYPNTGGGLRWRVKSIRELTRHKKEKYIWQCWFPAKDSDMYYNANPLWLVDPCTPKYYKERRKESRNRGEQDPNPWHQFADAIFWAAVGRVNPIMHCSARPFKDEPLACWADIDELTTAFETPKANEDQPTENRGIVTKLPKAPPSTKCNRRGRSVYAHRGTW